MSHVNTRASLPGGDVKHIKNKKTNVCQVAERPRQDKLIQAASAVPLVSGQEASKQNAILGPATGRVRYASPPRSCQWHGMQFATHV